MFFLLDSLHVYKNLVRGVFVFLFLFFLHIRVITDPNDFQMWPN